MQSAGFTRCKSWGGRKNRARTAEYLISGLAGTSRSVCELVSTMVDAVHTPNSILVREAGIQSQG